MHFLNRHSSELSQKKHTEGQMIKSKCKKCPAGTRFIWHKFVSRGFLCPICQVGFKSHWWVSLWTAQQYEQCFRVVSGQTAGNGVCLASSIFNVIKFSKQTSHNLIYGGLCFLPEALVPLSLFPYYTSCSPNLLNVHSEMELECNCFIHSKSVKVIVTVYYNTITVNILLTI